MNKRLLELLALANAIVDKADKEQQGIMTAEQVVQLEAYQKEMDGIKASIDAKNKLDATAYGLNQPTGRVSDPATPDIKVGKDRIEDDPKRGFANLGEFALAVKSALSPGGGIVDDRLRTLAAPSGQATSRGGDETFQVPSDFRDQIWDQVYGTETSFDLFNLFTPEPTSKSTVEISKDETTPWGTTGVQAYWGSESNQMTGSNPVTTSDYVSVNFLYAFVLATEDLLSDLPRLNDRLIKKSGSAIRFRASNAIVEGTGVGMLKGFKNSGALVTVSKESSQSAATIVAQNIANMYSRLINPQNGFWMVSPDVFPQIITMQVGNNPAWVPYSSGFQQKPNGLLLGQPMYMMEHCQTLGTLGDIYFVNPDGYMLLQRSSAPEYAESMHLYFDYNIHAFRWIFRIGGQPYSNKPVTPKNSSNTRSHFVTLAARP